MYVGLNPALVIHAVYINNNQVVVIIGLGLEPSGICLRLEHSCLGLRLGSIQVNFIIYSHSFTVYVYIEYICYTGCL